MPFYGIFKMADITSKCSLSYIIKMRGRICLNAHYMILLNVGNVYV